MGGLKEAVKLEEFPFTNRTPELETLTSFFCNNEFHKKTLLILGESGVGKSRLLENVISTNREANILIILHSKTHGNTSAGLLQNLSSEISKVGERSKFKTTTDGIANVAKTTPDYLRNVAPKLAKATPLLGDAAEHVVSSILDSNKQAAKARGKVIETHLLNLSKRSKGSPCIIIVDDIHSLNDTEKSILSDIMSLALRIENADIRFVLGARPSIYTSENVLKNILERISIEGHLYTLRLEGLAEGALKSLAVSIFESPASFDYLLDASAGNPQFLFSSLVSLNLKGKLKRKDDLLGMVGSATNSISLIENSPLDQFNKHRIARWLISVLAVARFEISLDTLKLNYQKFGASSSIEILNTISMLINAQILGSHADQYQRELVYLQHDSLKEAVFNELKSDKIIEFLQANEIVTEIANYELKNLALHNSNASSSNQPNEGISSIMVGRAMARRDARKRGWENEAEEILELCESLERTSDTIDLATALSSSYEGVLSTGSEKLLRVQKYLARALYREGRFSECVRMIDAANEGDGEMLYIHAMSHLISKPDDQSVNIAKEGQQKIQQIENESQWRPLLVLCEAVAMQESGRHRECESIYIEFLDTMGPPQTIQEWQFITAAPLFLKAKDAELRVQEAKNWFLQQKDNRMAGMAIHNLGYALMRQKRYMDAKKCFEKAVTLLNEKFPNEAVFPLNNLAFIALINSKGSEAEEYLIPCLFRDLWPEYEVSVLINFAYAKWMIRADNPLVFIDRINKIKGIETHDWAGWQIVYAKACIALLPPTGVPSEDDILQISQLMLNLSTRDAASSYWNALVGLVNERYGISIEEIPNVSAGSVMAETANPSLSIVRPSALCFAHF